MFDVNRPTGEYEAAVTDAEGRLAAVIDRRDAARTPVGRLLGKVSVWWAQDSVEQAYAELDTAYLRDAHDLAFPAETA